MLLCESGWREDRSGTINSLLLLFYWCLRRVKLTQEDNGLIPSWSHGCYCTRFQSASMFSRDGVRHTIAFTQCEPDPELYLFYVSLTGSTATLCDGYYDSSALLSVLFRAVKWFKLDHSFLVLIRHRFNGSLLLTPKLNIWAERLGYRETIRKHKSSHNPSLTTDSHPPVQSSILQHRGTRP